ncbi:MAG: methyl-accepting chemotaxis protein [Granulosicoccus sp.]
MNTKITSKTRIATICLLLATLILLTALSALYGLDLALYGMEVVTESGGNSADEGINTEIRTLETIRNVVLAGAVGALVTLIAMSYIFIRFYIAPLGAEPRQLTDLVSLLRVTESEESTNHAAEEQHGLYRTLLEFRQEKLKEDRSRVNIETAHSALQGKSDDLVENVESLESQLAALKIQNAEVEPKISRNDEKYLKTIVELVQAASTGDLSRTVTVPGGGVISELGYSLEILFATFHEEFMEIQNKSGTLRDSSNNLAVVNIQMQESASKASEQARLVCVAAEEISNNVDGVAMSVEEMSSSVTEISHNSAEAVVVADQAVVLATNTDSTVRKLSDSSNDIGAVVKVINSIAEQTNLLALNATIEAARAGDAGKGFAVVANEVKELAKETAKATDEIETKILTIQNDSVNAVKAIDDIGKIISQVSQIQSNIASAVQLHSAATEEIKSAVANVSQGSSEMALSVSQVNVEVNSNLDSMERAQKTLTSLDNSSSELKKLVSKYKLIASVPGKVAA